MSQITYNGCRRHKLCVHVVHKIFVRCVLKLAGKHYCVLQWDSLHDSVGDAFMKFEPFVLHVQCARLVDAQLLVSAPSVMLHNMMDYVIVIFCYVLHSSCKVGMLVVARHVKR